LEFVRVCTSMQNTHGRRTSCVVSVLILCACACAWPVQQFLLRVPAPRRSGAFSPKDRCRATRPWEIPAGNESATRAGDDDDREVRSPRGSGRDLPQLQRVAFPAIPVMVAEHGNVPDGRSCSRLLTSSDVKKDGLMMNKFDMPSAHMSKKSKAAPGVKALKRRLGKARERRRRRRRRLTIWRCTR